jgi:hypothetical protein
VQRIRETAKRAGCLNNLKQIGIALQHYHQARGSFPPAYRWVEPKDSYPWYTRPGWGWAAHLLPYVDQQTLFQQIDFNAPIEVPMFAGLRTTVLRVYVCPSDLQWGKFTATDMDDNPVADAATNSYAANYGSGKSELGEHPDAGNGVFFRNSAIRVADIPDGASTTWAIGERCSWFAQAPWAGAIHNSWLRTTPGGPANNQMKEEAPVEVMAGITNFMPLNDPGLTLYNFYSPHGQVSHFAYADGSARAVGTQTDPTILMALASRNGGELIGDGDY